MDTPYQWTKQVASHWGGTRNGTIVHWPNGIKAQGRDPQPVPSRHRRRADDPRSRRAAASDDRQQHAAGADRRRQHALCVQRRQGGGAARDAVLRDVLQPRHLPQGVDGGDAARRAVGWRLQARFDEDVWELYDTNTDWTQAKDLAKENPKKLAELQRLFLIEATQVQRAAARRSDVRTLQPRHRRPPAVDPGQDADPLRRHGPPHRELDRLDQEQVVRDHRRCRRAEIRCRGRHRRAGRQHQRLEPLCQGRKAEVLLQLLRHRR